MNRNAVIFVISSLVVLLGWQFVMEKLYPPIKVRPEIARIKGAAPITAATKISSEPVVQGAIVRSNDSKTKRQLVTVRTDDVEVIFSNEGAQVHSWRLLKFKEKIAEQDQAVELIVGSKPGAKAAYGALDLVGTDLASARWQLETPKPIQDAQGRWTVRFTTKVPGTALKVSKLFTLESGRPGARVSIELSNNSAQDLKLQPLSLIWGPNVSTQDDNAQGRFPAAAVIQTEGRIERLAIGSMAEPLALASPKWVAVKSHYFVVAFFPESPLWNQAEIRRPGAQAIMGALVAKDLIVMRGKTVTLEANFFAGPQEYDTLLAVGNNFQQVVQFQYYQLFDWLNPLCVGMLHVLKWFQGATGNWGVAIILLTLLVRGVLFYPSHRSMVSMRKMQTKMKAMQPRLETIKKVYKDDSQKLNAETMKLYKEHGVNPLGGCLPMLLQIPVFFALYGTLQAAFELRGAGFFWKWTDLSSGDPTFILPLLMGATMFVQQKMAPNPGSSLSDEQAQMQKIMLYMFPIMFTGMAAFMAWPQGLLLYWTASNMMGITQQILVNKTVK